MYPSEWLIEGILGSPVAGLDAEAAADLSYNEGYTYWTDFLFQGMFAATAATIISGAVAERIKISSFMLIASLYVAIVYLSGLMKQKLGFVYADIATHNLKALVLSAILLLLIIYVVNWVKLTDWLI